MAPEPTFNGACTSEVKLHKQKDKQKKYYTHIRLVQLNIKAAIELKSNFLLTIKQHQIESTNNILC